MLRKAEMSGDEAGISFYRSRVEKLEEHQVCPLHNIFVFYSFTNLSPNVHPDSNGGYMTQSAFSKYGNLPISSVLIRNARPSLLSHYGRVGKRAQVGDNRMTIPVLL